MDLPWKNDFSKFWIKSDNEQMFIVSSGIDGLELSGVIIQNSQDGFTNASWLSSSLAFLLLFFFFFFHSRYKCFVSCLLFLSCLTWMYDALGVSQLALSLKILGVHTQSRMWKLCCLSDISSPANLAFLLPRVLNNRALSTSAKNPKPHREIV